MHQRAISECVIVAQNARMSLFFMLSDHVPWKERVVRAILLPVRTHVLFGVGAF